MPETSMKAVRYDRYGPPDVLEVREVPRPEPQAGQVLVKVEATSVNPVEAKIRAGGLRLLTGRRFPKGTGADYSGTVAAAGPGADPGLVGRAVWGWVNPLFGAATAEYLAVDADSIAPAPSNVDLAEAAALPTVGISAMLALAAVRLEPGRRLLVVGAAGGVGSAAVQLAAARGANVAAVAGASNLDYCRELGAADVYPHGDPDALAGERFDAVVDSFGGRTGAYRGLVRPGGRMATLAMRAALPAAASVLLPGPTVRLVQMQATPGRLAALTRAVERGELRPAIGPTFPMAAIAEAHRSIETGHSRGKRLIRVAAPVD